MASKDRMIKRKPITTGPVKPKPKGDKNPKLPYRFPDGKKPFPKKPAPGTRPGMPRKPGKSDPRLPYRRPDSKPIPKKGNPGEGPKKLNSAKQAGGGIRDLLYRAKPGEMQKMPAKGRLTEKLYRKLEGNSKSNERLRKDNSPMKDKLQSMLKGTARKRDNSAVTYNTRVTPKGPKSMMEGPYRIKKATVKTGRGR